MNSKETIEKVREILLDHHNCDEITHSKIKGLKEINEEFNFENSKNEDRFKLSGDGSNKVIVYKVTSKKDGKVYALKCWLDINGFESDQLKPIHNLAYIYNHQNIIEYKDIFIFEMNTGMDIKAVIAVKMDYYEETLEKKLENLKEPCNAFEFIWFLNQTMDTIKYLKEKYDISLFNIKPSNIFIGKNGQLIFSDFGMSEANSTGKSINNKKVTGDVTYWMAPEYMKAIKKGKNEVEISFEKTDIYSLGMILLEMSTLQKMDLGKEEFTNLKLQVFFKKFKQVPKYQQDIIKGMTKGNFEQRDKADKVLERIEKLNLDEK